MTFLYLIFFGHFSSPPSMSAITYVHRHFGHPEPHQLLHFVIPCSFELLKLRELHEWSSRLWHIANTTSWVSCNHLHEDTDQTTELSLRLFQLLFSIQPVVWAAILSYSIMPRAVCVTEDQPAHYQCRRQEMPCYTWLLGLATKLSKMTLSILYGPTFSRT